jgi:Mlc titration factor MtfA (ptsG expression regulator)
MAKNKKSVSSDVKKWLAIRKKAALKIDPKNAKVHWTYAQTLDPYGVVPELPAECYQVGREYFARSPGSDVWVWFGDLPHATQNALWKKHSSK